MKKNKKARPKETLSSLSKKELVEMLEKKIEECRDHKTMIQRLQQENSLQDKRLGDVRQAFAELKERMEDKSKRELLKAIREKQVSAY